MNENTSLVSLYIDYSNNKISEKIEANILTTDQFHDVTQVVSCSRAFSFIEQDFERAVNQAVAAKVQALQAEIQLANDKALAELKLKLGMQYIESVGTAINTIKSLLADEFQTTDISVVESIVTNCLKQLDDEVLEKVFVSEATYKAIKAKVGPPNITILGATTPIGIGYGLNDQQIMIEGGRTVIVSDLGVIIDGYIYEKIKV